MVTTARSDTRTPDVLRTAIRDDLPALVDEIVTAIETAVPGYGQEADARERRALRRAVTRTLAALLVDLADPAHVSDLKEMYRAIGRAEQRSGRNTDALHAAYWIGARLTWRRWAHLGRIVGAPTPSILRLGEAVLVYVSGVARWAADGHSRAQLLAGDELTHVRRRLVELLVSDSEVSLDVLADAARAARWPVPETAVVVVSDRDAARPVGSLGPSAAPDVLRGPAEDPFLVVPGPDAAQRAEAAVREMRNPRLMVVGPAVPVTNLRTSLRVARSCLDLVHRGVLRPPASGTALRAADHLDAVLLFRDEAVLGPLIDLHLRALSGLTAKQQDRIVDTVLAWLTSGGRVQQAAARLGVHPQTVHHRIRRARMVMGDSLLRDPDRRLALQMALRTWQLLRTTQPPPSLARQSVAD